MDYKVVYEDFLYDVEGILYRYADRPETAVDTLNHFIKQQKFDILVLEVKNAFRMELEYDSKHRDSMLYFNFDSKLDFIENLTFSSENKDFLRKHFDDLDDIMEIVRNELECLEAAVGKTEGDSDDAESGTEEVK